MPFFPASWRARTRSLAPLPRRSDNLHRPLNAEPDRLRDILCYRDGRYVGRQRPFSYQQLRIILAELHTVTLRDTLSFASPWRRFDEMGHILDPEDAAAAEAAMAVFAHRLDWWVEALAHARQARPYHPEDA